MKDVVKADVVAELAYGGSGVHAALIDLIQWGLVEGLRDDDGVLRFDVTEAGEVKVGEMGTVTCIRGCPYYVKKNGVWVCGVCGNPQ